MMSAADLAVELHSALTAGESKGLLLRLVRQFVMDTESAADIGPLIIATPPLTGDARWDALLAGVVEDIALRRGAAVPAWTATDQRRLEQWWFVTDFPALHPTAFVETPAALANRGVFLRRASLVNI